MYDVAPTIREGEAADATSGLPPGQLDPPYGPWYGTKPMVDLKHDPRPVFKAFLTDEGLRWTPERETILEAVFSIHRHFGADELYDMLRERHHRVSRATIYRTLDLLVKSGLVADIDLGDGKTSFEHVFGHDHHDHLICTRCQKAIEFEEPEIERLQDEVCARLGFRADRHSLRIFGLCKQCQQALHGD